MSERPDAATIHRYNYQRNLTRALQALHGICSGIAADGELNDAEIKFLRLWLRENNEITGIWPANVISQRVHDILADGVITNPERSHLLTTLQDLTGHDFTDSGSATAAGPALPVRDDCEVIFPGQLYCFTGVFVYGTRAACERAVLNLSATCVESVSKKLDYLVVGSMCSADWFNTSYGRKIERAAQLREAGHQLHIITETRWSAALPHAPV